MERSTSKNFTLLLFIYPSKVDFIQEILYLHKWDLFYMYFIAFFPYKNILQ